MGESHRTFQQTTFANRLQNVWDIQCRRLFLVTLFVTFSRQIPGTMKCREDPVAKESVQTTGRWTIMKKKSPKMEFIWLH